ncbi:hypothetical protein [Streptomyces sp. NPDC001450]
MSVLLIVGVISGAVVEECVLLESCEDESTRWAMDFGAPDADAAAALAYVQCGTDGGNEETVGALLHAVLGDVSVRSWRGGGALLAVLGQVYQAC